MFKFVRELFEGGLSGFCRHSFNPTVELTRPVPRVYVSRLAHDKMWHYVDLVDNEVGWLGTVEKIEGDFLVTDVHLFRQRVTGSTNIIDGQALAEFANDILIQDPENGAEQLEKLCFWGHSHANMETFASSQDDRQMATFAQSGLPWFIRGIFNKKGKGYFTIYYFKLGLKIDDVEWVLHDPIDPELRSVIETEVKEKVQLMRTPNNVSAHHQQRNQEVSAPDGFRRLFVQLTQTRQEVVETPPEEIK